MAEYRRNEYLEKQLRARLRVFEPKAQDRAKYLLHFDLEQLVAALNDDAYLLKLMDILNKQLNCRQNWTEEAKVNRPFWWNHENKEQNGLNTSKSGKEEFEDVEQDPSVLISIKLAQMPSNHSKIAFLGTLLYPKIKELYPNQTNKLYNICLNYDIDELQQAVCNKDGLKDILTQAQIQLETQINQLKAASRAKRKEKESVEMKNLTTTITKKKRRKKKKKIKIKKKEKK